MYRYVSIHRRTVATIGEDEPLYNTITVHEGDAEPEDTGLLDASGTKLFRVRDREPIGYKVR